MKSTRFTILDLEAQNKRFIFAGGEGDTCSGYSCAGLGQPLVTVRDNPPYPSICICSVGNPSATVKASED